MKEKINQAFDELDKLIDECCDIIAKKSESKSKKGSK